jgi:flavin-binding protein dodecin
MEGSVYKVIEIVGTSATSWEDAAKVAIATASQTLEDLRIAEVVKQDVTVEKGKVTGFRVRLNISFKYHPSKGYRT